MQNAECIRDDVTLCGAAVQDDAMLNAVMFVRVVFCLAKVVSKQIV